jgi:hypothetical protein
MKTKITPVRQGITGLLVCLIAALPLLNDSSVQAQITNLPPSLVSQPLILPVGTSPTNSAPAQTNSPVAPAGAVQIIGGLVVLLFLTGACVFVWWANKKFFPAPKPLNCTNLVYSGNCYAPLNAKLQYVYNKNVLGKVYYVNPQNGYSIWVGPTAYNADGSQAFSWVYTDQKFGGTTLFAETTPTDTNTFFTTNGFAGSPTGWYNYPCALLGYNATNFGYWGQQANLVAIGNAGWDVTNNPSPYVLPAAQPAAASNDTNVYAAWFVVTNTCASDPNADNSTILPLTPQNMLAGLWQQIPPSQGVDFNTLADMFYTYYGITLTTNVGDQSFGLNGQPAGATNVPISLVNGVVTFTNGTATRTVVIESATALTGPWNPVVTLTLPTNMPLKLVDTAGPTGPNGFYRFRPQ